MRRTTSGTPSNGHLTPRLPPPPDPMLQVVAPKEVHSQANLIILRNLSGGVRLAVRQKRLLAALSSFFEMSSDSRAFSEVLVYVCVRVRKGHPQRDGPYQLYDQSGRAGQEAQGGRHSSWDPSKDTKRRSS